MICRNRTSALNFHSWSFYSVLSYRLGFNTLLEVGRFVFVLLLRDAGQYQILPAGCYDEPTTPGKGSLLDAAVFLRIFCALLTVDSALPRD